jgi:adenosine deaminase CECR1
MRPSLETDSDGPVTRPKLKVIIALFAVLLVLMKRLLLKRKRAAAPPPAVSKEMVMDLADGDPYAAQNDYEVRKRSLLDSESRVAWDADATASASPAEKRAQIIAFKIREDERRSLFGNVATEAIPGSDTRDMGGQFLTNKERILKSNIYRMAQRMPKGCHLHLHFNAELMEPNDFIQQAQKNPNMYVRSTRRILTESDFDEAEIVFNVLPSSTVEADIFKSAYNPEFRAPGATPWMKWNTFRAAFYGWRRNHKNSRIEKHPEEWIRGKLVLTEQEVYGINQTTNGYVQLQTAGPQLTFTESGPGSTRQPGASKGS